MLTIKPDNSTRYRTAPARYLRRTVGAVAAAVSLMLVIGCAGPSRLVNQPEREQAGTKRLPLPLTSFRQVGMASFYAEELHHYRTTSGESYDMNGFTAAHPVLPFNTLVKVTNLSNHLSVIVRINDRGPYTKRRIIDLSRAAALQIGLVDAGTAKVELEVVGDGVK